MESIFVSHDKISMPVSPSIILHRQALVQSLTAALMPRDSEGPAPNRLVLLYAPSGYGKTTLLLDTVRQLASVCCWYILDESDADPAVFLTRLCASLQYAFPTLSLQTPSFADEVAFEIGSDTASTTRHLHFLDRLLDLLKKDISEHFVLIICNYHEVNDSAAINWLVDRLLARLPDKGVLVLESRAMPEFMLAPLIARRQMFGLGHSALRFTAQEIYELAQLQSMNSFPLQEAERLTNMFDGWIAGILLGSCLGYEQFQHAGSLHAERWSEQMPGDDQTHLLAYIQGEVFKQETASYEFLKRTSILERLTAEHCNALLEIDNAGARLMYAEQRGLFVVRVRGSAGTTSTAEYICHPAVRQLFSQCLQREAPADYHQLHLRAAHILHADQQYEQALMHACSAHEYRQAADIIIERAAVVNYEEHGDMLLHWLDMLPEAIFKQYPRLLLIAANIHLRHGEFALVPPLLDTIDSLEQTLPAEEDESDSVTLKAELSIARGHLYLFQGEFSQTQNLCQQALALLLPDERKLRIRAHQYLGVSMIVGTGQVHEGIVQLHRALQMSRSQENPRQVATLHRLVANAYSWIGNQVLAEYHQMRAFQVWERMNNSRGMIYCLTSLGLLKLRQGFAQQAEELLRRALNQSRGTLHFKSGEAYALVALGDLFNRLGQYAEALNYLEDGLNLARICEDRYLTCCALYYLALSYLFLDDAQTAHFFINQVVLKEGEKHSFEGCLFYLTQGTVYLTERDYDRAEPILEHAVATAERANILIIYISALLRLTICYLRQGKKNAAFQVGERIIDLNKKGDFDFFLQVECRRYYELHAFLEQLTSAGSAENGTLPLKPASQQSPLPAEGSLEVVVNGNEGCAFQILALGEPKVVINGVPVTRWRMAHAMELFFFLLEIARPVRKEQITTALWSEHDSDQNDSTVRTTIYYLRKVLGEGTVIFQSGLYSLNLPEPASGKLWYDVQVFSEQYSWAKKALLRQDDDQAAAAFSKMLNLYGGDYVQSFYNDWCSQRREELRQAYMDAHHQLALIAWRHKNWDDSLQHWQSLLAVDSCHEAAHYGIMRCYLQQGKREQALRQFQTCSQILMEELQTTPRASLQKLYQSILG
ncbi:MAG TPA: BTAD domain-containing putative transcriptional regulator [Ktedonobacteraceae bacterium]|nr:BTAD domain-containing putative transcriptional regulator [Ktedonobacteraceae bacterium]